MISDTEYDLQWGYVPGYCPDRPTQFDIVRRVFVFVHQSQVKEIASPTQTFQYDPYPAQVCRYIPISMWFKTNFHGFESTIAFIS